MKDLHVSDPAYFSENQCDLDELKALTAQRLDAADAPLAVEIQKNIPIYDVQKLNSFVDPALLGEWAHGLRWGAGILVLRNAYPDTTPIDEATLIYNQIIERETQASGGGADHFAKAGSNARIWNSLQKLCMADPGVFARYFGNCAIDAVCRAWLGPNYQMTAQVNVVRPGGQAQQAHRDYHLGFQTAEISATYPAHVHDLSSVLTLQGGIAHGDTPLESGPTKLLPFSQSYRPGYAAWRRNDFRSYFEEAQVQIPLQKGDALFFNPATFHAAGANVSTGIQRMVNLLQVSSAFGRAMETIDRQAMCIALFPQLQRLSATSTLTPDQIDAAIASCAEGYSFPTNLDRDPPAGGLAPLTQNAVLHRALADGWNQTKLQNALQDLAGRQRP